MTNLHIRDAIDADRDAILSVTLAAFEQYAAIMGENWKYYRENIVETLADAKPAEQIVAETEEGIAGAVLLYPAETERDGVEETSDAPDGPQIRLLAVAPTARGRGIGAALARECVRRARQSGAAALSLHTTDMMSVAMRMYERMGFVRVPAFDYHPGGDVVVKAYRLDLADH